MTTLNICTPHVNMRNIERQILNWDVLRDFGGRAASPQWFPQEAPLCIYSGMGGGGLGKVEYFKCGTRCVEEGGSGGVGGDGCWGRAVWGGRMIKWGMGGWVCFKYMCNLDSPTEIYLYLQQCVMSSPIIGTNHYFRPTGTEIVNVNWEWWDPPTELKTENTNFWWIRLQRTPV